MTMIKKVLFWNVIAFLLMCSVCALSESKGIDLEEIQMRDGFLVLDEKSNEWVYYSKAETKGSRDKTIQMYLVSWGIDDEMQYHPEIWFTVSDLWWNDKPQKVILLIGKNEFEISLKEYKDENNDYSYAILVKEDESLIKSLAAGLDCQVHIHCRSSIFHAYFSKEELVSTRENAVDMLRYNFLQMVEKGNADNVAIEPYHSSISASIYENLDKDELIINYQSELLSGLASMMDAESNNDYVDFEYMRLSCRMWNNGTVEIIKGIPNEKNIAVPDSINGSIVTKIGDRAFAGMALENISLPEGLLTIGKEAFFRCPNLKNIIIPDSVLDIEEGAFSYSGLSLINIPSNVRSLGSRCFSHCTDLVAAYFTDGINNVGERTFSDCERLISVRLPKTLLYLSKSMFFNCYNLSEIIIPKGVKYIGEVAFSNCMSLNKVVIPDSVVSIEDYAFRWCSNLQYIYIPESVIVIGYAPFMECGIKKMYTVEGSETYNSFKNSPGVRVEKIEPSTVWNDDMHDILIGSYQFDKVFHIDNISLYLSNNYVEIADVDEMPFLRGLDKDIIKALVTPVNTVFLACDETKREIVYAVVNAINQQDNMDDSDPKARVAVTRSLAKMLNGQSGQNAELSTLMISYDFAYDDKITWYKVMAYNYLYDVNQMMYTAIVGDKQISVVFLKRTMNMKNMDQYDDIIRLCTIGEMEKLHSICGNTGFDN